MSVVLLAKGADIQVVPVVACKCSLRSNKGAPVRNLQEDEVWEYYWCKKERQRKADHRFLGESPNELTSIEPSLNV